MKNQLMLLGDKLLLRKRAIIETVVDQLKNIAQIEHTRHRSPVNLVVHIGGRADRLLLSARSLRSAWTKPLSLPLLIHNSG